MAARQSQRVSKPIAAVAPSPTPQPMVVIKPLWSRGTLNQIFAAMGSIDLTSGAATQFLTITERGTDEHVAHRFRYVVRVIFGQWSHC